MKIEVYNSDTLYATYEFYESSKKVADDFRHPPLVNAMMNTSYLNKYTGFIYYLFYLTSAELKSMSELYAYQEGDYELRWIDSDNSYKVFLVSDFIQKNVNYKDAINLYEFPLTLEIVKAVDLETDLYHYSDHFVVDTASVTEFVASYPKWTLAGSPTGTQITTNDSYLILDSIAGYQGVYQDMSGYSKTTFTMEWLGVLPSSVGGSIPLLVYYENGNAAQILLTPETSGAQIKHRIRTDYIEGTHHYGTYNDITTDDYTKFDFKIIRTLKNYKAYFKKSADSSWTALETYDFTDSQTNYRLYCYGYNNDFKINEFKLDPDELV
jgi:hypothetical protein